MKLLSLSVIMRAGTVIITTIASFAVTPPVISARDSGVSWRNVLIFFAGVLSILIYDWIKDKTRRKVLGFGLVALLVILIGIYENMYYKYSETCFNVRCVISTAAPKSDELKSYQKYWGNRSDSMKKFLEANGCSPVEIWNMSDLYFPYYCMLILYFLIVIDIIFIMAFLTDLIKPK